MKALTAIVLAAGDAKRMRSSRPKVLHRLGGRPLIEYSVRACRALGARLVLVIGRSADDVRAAVGDAADIAFVEQKERLGTGHAVLQARAACADTTGTILVLPADVPLIEPAAFERLVAHHDATGAACTILSAMQEDPTGYGRVVRDGEGRPVGIIEHKDASTAQRAIREIGTSIYCFEARWLWPALEQVTPHNEQGEYYLTDVIDILGRAGRRIEAVRVDDADAALGINDRKQLAAVAAILRAKVLDRLMADGVTVLDPRTTYVDDTVEIGTDTVLYPGVVLEGRTVIGRDSVVGPGCQVIDSAIGDGVTLRAYCVVAQATVEDGAALGPFCHLRPLSHVGPEARIGNFVELKKARIGRRAKVPHLSYVGDATVGAEANIGAGAITCNYDGVKKNETVIGDGAFIGTNAALVAPLTVGAGAYVAAGSVITKDVPPDALAVARGRQEMREGWAQRKKKPRHDDKGN